MLKRDKIKYIRDRAKAAYEKGENCEICGVSTNLDFHHFYSLTPLLDKWLVEKQKSSSQYTDEHILVWRDEFIEQHLKELYEETVTLCHNHHLKLHSVYGKNPALFTAEKQKKWVGIQKEKHIVLI